MRLFVVCFALLSAGPLLAEDWTRFRGDDGSGIAASVAPTTWSDKENLVWKTPLPGPGSSSPIALGDRVYVTCYSGYGVDARNANSGKLRWFVRTEILGNVSPSVMHRDGVIYATGGIRGSGSMAVRVGGKGDITDSNVIWSSRNSSYVATPVLYEGHLYWVDDRGQAWCSRVSDGEQVYRERLADTGGGRPFYASPVLADGKLYCVSRRGGTFVLAGKPTFSQIAVNRFDGDDTDFNATPAIVDGEIVLRSNQALYCVKSRPSN